MKKIEKIKEYVIHPRMITNKCRWMLTRKGFYDSWSDEKYLSHKYEIKFKRKLNLDNPKLYTEKFIIKE